MARGRIPGLWLRKSTGQWYTTLDGKQIALGRRKGDAAARLNQLLVQRGKSPSGASRLSISQVVNLWLEDVQSRVKPASYESYCSHARSLSDYCGGLWISDLKAYHVVEWCKSCKTDTTRHNKYTVAKAITRWAEDLGYIDKDPLRRLRKPAIARRVPVTLDDFGNLALRLGPFTAPGLLFLRLTGVRPGELCSMQIENLSGYACSVQGKTGTRQIHLSEAASKLLRAVIGSRTHGPVWLNSLGKPLTVYALNASVRRARGKELSHVVPHGLRGLYSTEALRAGVDSLLVSKLLGHRDPSMLAKHYANVDGSLLKEAAEKASGKSSQPLRTIDVSRNPCTRDVAALPSLSTRAGDEDEVK